MLYRNALATAGVLAGLSAGLLPGLAGADEVHEHWRLFVGDHEAAKLSVIELEDGEVAAEYELNSPATLYATASRAAVFAVQAAGNRVTLIESGIGFEDHGDHGDLHVEAPELGGVIEGQRPVHFVDHGGEIALFFDGEGIARLVDEASWREGAPKVSELKTAAPHHGVAISFGAEVLMSVPHPEDPSKLPVGIEVLDRSGNRVGDVADCPDLHGEASSGALTAIACAEGVLIARSVQGKAQIERVDYPASLPGGKITTLLGGVGMEYFLGNYGPAAVALFEPGAAEPFRLVELPSRRVHFAVDPQRPRFAYVLTEDGVLRELDVVAGVLTREVKVTDAYSMDGGSAIARPRIAVAGQEIVVTDPAASRLHVVDAESLAVEREITVAGKPFTVVAVGGTGSEH